MKNKVLKAVMVISLIITLTIADFVLLGTQLITYALESNSVTFAAYFKTEEGEVLEADYQINSNEMMLYLKIDVTSQGFFDCGVVTLGNGSNFKVKQDNQNEFIKEIAGNKIYLEKITDEVEIPLAIEPVIEESYEENMLSKETVLTLEGDYNDGIETINPVEAEETVTLNLTVPENIVTSLQVKTITNKDYQLSDGNKRIVQVELNSTVIDNVYPIKSTTFDLELPDGVESVQVITQGTYATNGQADRRLEYTHDKVNNSLKVVVQNTNQDGIISWKKDAIDNIIVTLTLAEEPEEQDGYIVKSTVELYGANINPNMTTLKQTSIYNLVESVDEVIGGSNISKEEIYKGKLYSKEDREYATTTNLELNYANLIEGNTLEETTVYRTDAGDIAANNIEYKTTTISIAEIEKILGTQGTLTIKNGSKTEEITAETVADENGNVVITYEPGVKNLQVTVTGAVATGVIRLKHTKVIKADTTLTDENIETFKYLVEKGTVKYDTVENSYEGCIELKDIMSEVSIILPQAVTSEVENQMPISLTLKTDSEKYQLFENPKFIITMPEGIVLNSLTNAAILPENDELAISTLEIVGDRQIQIELAGKQENYVASSINTQISFIANASVNKLMPNKSDRATLYYENRGYAYEKQSDLINITASNSNVVTHLKLENYNGEGAIVERYNDNTAEINGDLPISNEEEIEVNATYTIINNYNTAISIMPVIVSTMTSKEGTQETLLNYAEQNVVIEAGAMVEVERTFKVKADLYYNEKINVQTMSEYDYYDTTYQVRNDITLETDGKEGARDKTVVDNKIKVETFTQLGDGTGIKETDEIYNEQIVTYIIKLTNISEETISNLVVTNTHENGNIYDLKEIKVINLMIQKEPFYEHRYEELDTNIKVFETIETLEPGATEELICKVVVKKTDENSVTSANISISADGIEEKEAQKVSNNVKDAILKVTSRKSLNEEVGIYGNTTLFLLSNVKNLTQEKINNTKVRIYLSEGLSWTEGSFIGALDLNEVDLDIIGETTYNEEQNYVEFELLELQADQEVIITSMMYINAIPVEMNLTKENVYFHVGDIISNNIEIIAKQQATRLTISQTINIDPEQKLKDGETVTIRAEVTNLGIIPSLVTIKDYLPEGLEATKVTLIQNGERTDKTNEEDSSIAFLLVTMNPGEKIEIEIEATINTARIAGESIENKITAISSNGEIADSNIIVLNIEKITEGESEEVDPEPVPDPEGPTENEDPDIEIIGPEDSEKINITVTKIWEDNNNQDNKRAPYTIMMTGKVEDIVVYTNSVTLQPNQTEYTWEDLAKYQNEEEIIYTVDETEVPDGYTKEINGFTITNRYIPETKTIIVTKVWQDNNQVNKRGEYQVTVTGKVGDEIVYSDYINLSPNITEINWRELPKYDNGQEIVYTIDETLIPEGYTKEIDGYTITNKYTDGEIGPEDPGEEDPTEETTRVTVTKVWDDNNNQYGKRGNYEVTIIGKVGENVVYTNSVILTPEQIGYTWENLPIYSNGEEIVYTVDETVVPEGYTKEIDGFIIKNKYTAQTIIPEVQPDNQEKISVTVTKVWEDNNNQDGKRANYTIMLIGKVEETVVHADSITLTPDQTEYTWENLPKYDNGKEITYSVDETLVPEGYTKVIEGYRIINTYTPETIRITATKIWDDNNNQYGKRENYEITIIGNVGGRVVYRDSVVLTPEQTECTWIELPKYSNGEEIQYTVDETEVPEGYRKQINGYTITNTYVVGTPDPEDPTPETPDPEDPTPETPDPENPTPEVSKYKISGYVWIDKNENSVKDQDELISDVIVKVIDLNNNNTFLKDKNGKEIEVKTNKDGQYLIENLEKGNYNLIFKYDTNIYELAENNGIRDYIIESTKEKVAITNKINLTSDKTINLKLMELTEFNLKIDKYISKVIVQTKNGTKTTGYVNKQFAREEIQNKYLAGSTLLVEYTLEINNMGELAGYASEIRDYLPDDMKFHSELNKQWYVGEDGNLYNTSLASTQINPGESKTVKLVLVKTMTKQNTGLTSNIAEISKTTNVKEYEDIDLNNNQSKAEIIVNPATGSIVTYIIAALNGVAIVALGMYIIKKKVIK